MHEEQEEMNDNTLSHQQNSSSSHPFPQTPFANGAGVNTPITQTTQSMSRMNLGTDNNKVDINIGSNLTRPITPLASVEPEAVHVLIREHAMARANASNTPPMHQFMQPHVGIVLSLMFDARASEFPTCTNEKWKELSDSSLASALVQLVGTPQSIDTKLSALGAIRQKGDNDPISVKAISAFASLVYGKFNQAQEFDKLRPEETKASLRVLLDKIKGYNQKLYEVNQL